MIKIPYKYAAVILGAILWLIYRVEKEFAFYNIYSVFSYTAHEILALVPLVLMILTGGWFVFEVRKQIKSKHSRVDRRFSVLLFVLFVFQFAHFYTMSQTVSSFTVGKIIDVNHETGTMIIETSDADKVYQFEVQAEGAILNIFEPGDEEYGISYEFNNNKPEVRKVSSIIYRPLKDSN